MAGPSLSGIVQLTVRLVTDAADTHGASGLPGASRPTSLTVTVIACVAVFTRVSVPLVAVTTTTYSLLPASLAGMRLTLSLAFSKFFTVASHSWPVSGLILKAVSSPPPVIS